MPRANTVCSFVSLVQTILGIKSVCYLVTKRSIEFLYTNLDHSRCHKIEKKTNLVPVEIAPNQVMSEMVLDGGGHFIPAGIFGVHTLSLLLTSLVAHDRAKEDTHKHHTGKEHKKYNYTHTH